MECFGSWALPAFLLAIPLMIFVLIGLVRKLRGTSSSDPDQGGIPVDNSKEIMDYRGELLEDNKHDVLGAAIDRAFEAYNRPNVSHEAQLVFVESLPDPLRFALVCFLYEAEINNGGVDLVFSCIGLLIPEIISGFSYFDLDRQAEHLRGVVSNLQLDEFPRVHDELMDAWDAWYTEDQVEFVPNFESKYAAIECDTSSRARIESRIGTRPDLYLRNWEGTGP